MKAPFKLCKKGRYLAIIAGLALAASPLGVQSAVAQATTTPATPPTPAPSGTAATAPTKTSAPPSTSTDTDTGTLDAPDTDLTNWVTFGGGDAFVSGNKGEYKHQQDTNSGPYGGVQDFHWQQFIGKDGTFTMDGHGLFGNHDYDLKLDLTDDKLGYIRAGYTEFRTWYDPTGGYYPINGLSFQPSQNDLYIDRRQAWIEAGLTLPNWPSFALRYEYDSREGIMDSTSWGQTTLIPGGTQTKIVPTYQGIDETRNIFSFTTKDKIGNTDADLGLRYEIDNTNDSTYIDQSPGQAANAFITQQNLEKDDLFNVHGATETLFNKQVTLSSGFSVTTIGTNLGGSRIYGPAYSTPLSPTFVNNGSGFIGLGGDGSTQEYTANLNLMLTPMSNLVVVPAVRVEYEGSTLGDNYNTTTGVGKGFVSTPVAANANNYDLTVAESLEARYTGFRDWSLYLSAELSEDEGNQAWNSSPVQDTINLNQNFGEFCQKYTAGANWYPLAQLNFGGQYYHEIHDYSFTNSAATPLISQYPGYLQDETFTTDDMNLRATWQALSNVSLITRYDFQYSTVDTTSKPDPNIVPITPFQSAIVANHILSESATWTPLAALYLQVGGSYVINSVTTPMINADNLVLSGNNNYWTLNASAGYEFNEKTRLQLEYSYYNADDYYNNAPSGLPYGADAQQNEVSATLTRQINKSVQVSLKYSFSRYRDQTDGGLDNYDAHLVYLSTQFRF